MKKSNRITALLAAFAAALTMSFGPAIADVTDVNLVAPNENFPRVWRAYPEMDARFERVGTPRSVAQVRRLAVGDSKQQLVNAVGQPASAYGDGSWNFNVALPLPERNRLICQYRVFFDAQDRVSGSIWRRPQCAGIVLGSIR